MTPLSSYEALLPGTLTPPQRSERSRCRSRFLRRLDKGAYRLTPACELPSEVPCRNLSGPRTSLSSYSVFKDRQSSITCGLCNPADPIYYGQGSFPLKERSCLQVGTLFLAEEAICTIRFLQDPQPFAEPHLRFISVRLVPCSTSRRMSLQYTCLQ